MESKASKPGTRGAIFAVLITLAIAISAPLRAQTPASADRSDPALRKLSVQLPASEVLFPAGAGAEIANSECLICHSAGMVFSQPARTPSQWQAIINKMRSVYGAPLPAEQVDALAMYLSKLPPGTLETLGPAGGQADRQ